MTKKVLPIIIAVVVIGVGAFYGGMKYAESKSPTNSSLPSGNFQNRGAANGAGGMRAGNGQTAGMNAVNGEIISKDDKSVTLKLRDGGSQIVFLSNTTEITKSAAGSLSDLEVGQNVFIGGKKNSDGSVTANTIQLRPNISPSSPSSSPSPTSAGN